MEDRELLLSSNQILENSNKKIKEIIITVNDIQNEGIKSLDKLAQQSESIKGQIDKIDVIDDKVNEAGGKIRKMTYRKMIVSIILIIIVLCLIGMIIFTTYFVIKSMIPNNGSGSGSY